MVPVMDETLARVGPRVAWLSVASGLAYLALSTTGMVLYPGGTKVDPSTTGYRFFENMFSDMGRHVSHSGAPNVIPASLFVASMCMLAVALIPFYIVQSKTLDHAGKGKAGVAWILGSVSAIFLALAGIFSQDVFPVLHLRLAQLVFVFVVPAVFIYAWLIFNDTIYPMACGITYIVFGCIVLAGIAAVIISGEPDTLAAVTIQATAQKVMVYAWTATMFVQARGLLDRSRKL